MPSFREQLTQAREHVLQGEKRVVDQTVLIERLRADGYDTTAAETLLATFIDVLEKMNYHLRQLEREAEQRAQDKA